jgi:hypothetical protein
MLILLRSWGPLFVLSSGMIRLPNRLDDIPLIFVVRRAWVRLTTAALLATTPVTSRGSFNGRPWLATLRQDHEWDGGSCRSCNQDDKASRAMTMPRCRRDLRSVHAFAGPDPCSKFLFRLFGPDHFPQGSGLRALSTHFVQGMRSKFGCEFSQFPRLLRERQ